MHLPWTSSIEYPVVISQAGLKRKIVLAVEDDYQRSYRIQDCGDEIALFLELLFNPFQSEISKATPWINHGRPSSRRIILASQ